MLDLIKERFDYKHDGLYYKSGKRAGTIRPDGYRQIGIKIDDKKKFFLEHRLCFYYMNNRWPKEEIDHIDRNKQNNAYNNLRECSRIENNRNKIHNKGIKPYKNQFTVEFRCKGKYYYLGRFDTYNEALNARQQAELQYWS